MGERNAGFAGLPEQLRQLFPDGNWPEYPFKKRSQAVPIDSTVASSLLALIPDWAGDWDDFAPYLRRSGYEPKDLPQVTVKIISTVAAEQAQENMERRASRGLPISGGVGTCTSTFVTFRLGPQAEESDKVERGGSIAPAGRDDGTVKTACGLTDMRKSFVVAMLANEATNSRETCRKEMIQEAAREMGYDVGKSFASHSTALRDAGLIDSQQCPPYGYWLTDVGIKVAEYLRVDDPLFAAWYRRWQSEDAVPRSKAL